MTKANFPEMVDERTVSEKWAIPVQTLRNWRHLGKGPTYVKIMRNVRYPVNGLNEWAEKHSIQPEERI